MGLEVRRAIEGDGLACCGVGEGDALGVKHQASGCSAIEAVSHDGTV